MSFSSHLGKYSWGSISSLIVNKSPKKALYKTQAHEEKCKKNPFKMHLHSCMYEKVRKSKRALEAKVVCLQSLKLLNLEMRVQ